jgi:hypothetical protein
VRRVFAAAAVVLAFVAAGCGSDEETAPPVAPPPPPAETDVTDTGATDTGALPDEGVSAEAWAEEVCTSVAGWQTDVQDASTELQSSVTDVSNVEEARDALFSFLETTVGLTDQLIADIEAAGAPAVERGDEIRSTLQSSLTEVRSTFDEARAEAQELPTDDPQAFVTGAQQIASSIGAGISGAVQALQELSAEPGVAESIAETPACAELGA